MQRRAAVDDELLQAKDEHTCDEDEACIDGQPGPAGRRQIKTSHRK